MSGPWAVVSAHERSPESAHERSPWALMSAHRERSWAVVLKSLMGKLENLVMSAHERSPTHERSLALMSGHQRSWALMSAHHSWALMSAHKSWALIKLRALMSAQIELTHAARPFYAACYINVFDLCTRISFLYFYWLLALIPWGRGGWGGTTSDSQS